MIALYAQRQKNRLRKRQARIFYITASASFALGSLTDLVLPNLGVYAIPAIANILALIWAGGLVYLIVKYRFLVLTPETIADDIVSTMTEALVLFNPKGSVVGMNQAGSDLLGYSERELRGKHIKRIFVDEKTADKVVNGVIDRGTTRNYSCALQSKSGESIEVLLSCSSIQHDDAVSGVVCVARDIREQLKAREEIEVSEARYRNLVEKAGIAILIDSKDGAFNYFNKRFADLFGYSAKEMQSESIQTLVHPEDVEWVMKYHTGRFGGQKVPHRYEFRGVRKDGSTIYLETDVTALREKGKVIGTRSYIWNITERKKIEEQLRKAHSELERRVRERTADLVSTNEALEKAIAEKEVLLREIQHRVKNNLQVIQSMLSLQSRHAHDSHTQTALEESRSRIQAMTMVYEQLYEAEDLSRIDFNEYMGKLTKALYVFHHGDRKAVLLNTNIDHCQLDIGSAIPSGLIVSELVLNALKHAFPEDVKGKIDVAFHAGKNRQCTLTVKDNGVGLPEDLDIDAVDTLGLQLVRALVEQLEGNIEVVRKEGTEFIISFKTGNRRRYAKGKDTGRRR
jgi:PAS domain S-box-containing protein